MTDRSNWWLKHRRYRRAGQVAEAIGWLLAISGLVAPSIGNRWQIGLPLIALGIGSVDVSWRLHRIAGMAQVEHMETPHKELNG